MKNCLGGVLIGLLLVASPCCQSAEQSKNRPAAVAGSFYPADPAQLIAFIDSALARADAPNIDGTVIGLVAPHAGYSFSGGVAAYSYAAVKGKHFKRVVIIGPTHVEPIGFTSVYDGDSYCTPLGKVEVDREFARKLAHLDPSIRLSSTGHAIHKQQSEHSLEVQLPFLQRALSGEFKIVPIVMGEQSYESSRALGLALEKLLRKDNDTLLVASSDLSHYHKYDDAGRKDRNLLNAITQNDFLTVSRNLDIGVWEACGGAPIVAVMIATQHLGGSAPRLLKYANSGDVTGDKSRVVGYAAFAIIKGRPKNDQKASALSDQDKAELLRIARASVESAVRDHKVYEPAVPATGILLQERGAFVTLREKGELRGCIGYTSPIYPLYQTVRDVAALAALRDPRFSPVRESELKDLQYEISVLSPMQHVLDTSTIKIGEHGLLIRKGSREGLLLPQVPVEQRWDRATFLQEVSLKAGFPGEAWRDEDADLFTFTATVFSDRDVSAAKR
ncbi:MAG: AmmeMemoRadiSam system protein B [Terriglobia bacterium]|jgi:AmmeMemoRadiSam system protein B/AmmeMemoRadiSam system protein A|nr:AmmeMemoRadiSam system protein B [Terriglobia bacterium]